MRNCGFRKRSIHFPDPLNIEAFSDKIRPAGRNRLLLRGHRRARPRGVQRTDRQPVLPGFAEEFKQSKTRILPLNKETIVMNATRSAGGRLNDFPPMAVTAGLADILASEESACTATAENGRKPRFAMRSPERRASSIRSACCAAIPITASAWTPRRRNPQFSTCEMLQRFQICNDSAFAMILADQDSGSANRGSDR